MTPHAASVDGLSLHVTSEGAGPAILLAHGMLCDSRVWAPVVADVATDHRAITLDLRGHGKSGVPAADYTLSDHARDLLAALDATGTDHAIVVGHGIGGIAALHLALSHPDRVEGVLLFNTTSEAEEKPFPWRIAGRLALHLGLKPNVTGQLAGLLFGKTSLQTRAKVVEGWKTAVADIEPKQVHRALRAWVRRPSIERSLAKVACYTISVAGSEDPAISPDNAKRIQEAVPGARHKVIQGVGHMAPLEKPEAVIEWIRFALDDMQGPRDMRTGQRQKK